MSAQPKLLDPVAPAVSVLRNRSLYGVAKLLMGVGVRCVRAHSCRVVRLNSI
jgi:hypothetical protein